MPFNSIKTYPQLLELAHLDSVKRKESLYAIFKRDIEDNHNFNFLGKIIRPIKIEGKDGMEILYTHLTCEEIEEKNEDGSTYKKRYFEIDRARRLHWVLPHISEKTGSDIIVFSVSERDKKKRVDVIKTYIYNREEKYIVILLPQRSGTDYYLLTAYHLNREGGVNSIENKLKKRLADIH